MIELALKNIVKYFGATKVLEDITFEVHSGEKIGLVGRNGSGKSTILKIISGFEQQDSGDLMIKKGTTISYLSQMPIYPEGFSVRRVINSAFEDIAKIEEELEKLEARMRNLKDKELERVLEEYSFLQHRFEVLGGYDREEKLSRVCVGLKLTEEFMNQDFDTLSGGEKTTVVLGKILLEEPDLLLLDEPTNHLDMDAIEWLEDYLREYKGMVIIVSHDRYFLDKVVTKIIEVEDMASETYKGNYSDYIKLKEENLMLQFEHFKEQQKKIKAMEKAIKDLRDWAIRADNNKFFRRAASMQKRLDKLEKVDKPTFEREKMKISFKDTTRSGRDVIIASNLKKSYGNKVLFDDAELLLRYGEKTAFVGPNGSGKSTLLKILLGEESTSFGEAKFGANIKCGYLPQIINFPNEEMTVLECFREGITIPEGKAREYLSNFLFFGNSAFKKVKSLSGGEKSRLKLSRLLYDEINLLILDEPTNHLDIDSIETLEEMLATFDGTIFFISHDRYFINKIGERIISLENKKLVSYPGNYDYFREKKTETTVLQNESHIEKKEINEKMSLQKTEKKNEFKIGRLEVRILELEKSLREVDDKMKAVNSDYEALNKYLNEKSSLQRELEEAMEEWIRMS